MFFVISKEGQRKREERRREKEREGERERGRERERCGGGDARCKSNYN